MVVPLADQGMAVPLEAKERRFHSSKKKIERSVGFGLLPRERKHPNNFSCRDINIVLDWASFVSEGLLEQFFNETI